MEEEYLAFVDEIGRTRDGKYIYRFDFTIDTETVWGDFFNVAPAVNGRNLQPDPNCLTKTAKVIFPRKMVIAKQNYCFSMQDCIDGIIPLIFCEIDEDTIEYKETPLFFKFGEKMSYIEEVLNILGIEMFEIEEVKRGDDSAIDNLINSMDNGDEEDGYDPDF